MSKQKSRHTHFRFEDYNVPTEPVERVSLPPTGPLYLPAQPSQSAGYPAPSKKDHGSPPGGSAAVYWPARVKRYHRSSIPGLVRVGLVLVQLALLVRLVCLVLNIQATTSWLILLFAAGDLFVEPVRWLAAQLTLSWLSGTVLLTDLEFVGAILAYGLLSWLLVRILKVLLNH